MAVVKDPPVRMILPPDGRQIHIDFLSPKQGNLQSSELWNTFSSFFKPRKKGAADLEFFATQLENEGYAEKTRQSYEFMVRKFFEHFEDRPPRLLTMSDIEDYNYEFFVSGRYSRSYQLQFISALQLYYSLCEGIELRLKQLRKTSRLPRS